jgi:hypothetical protein
MTRTVAFVWVTMGVWPERSEETNKTPRSRRLPARATTFIENDETLTAILLPFPGEKARGD